MNPLLQGSKNKEIQQHNEKEGKFKRESLLGNQE